MPERTRILARSRCLPVCLSAATLLLCGITPATFAAKGASDYVDELYRLAPRGYPDEVTSEAGYGKWLTTTLAELESRLPQTKAPADRAQLLLSLANLRLARQAEPPLSRVLLGDESKQTLLALEHAADKALAEIAQADKLLDKLDKGKATDKVVARKLESWRQAVVQLEPLAVGMKALVSGKDLDRAITALEPLLKGKPVKTSSMAGLLHKALLLRAGKIDKLLEVTAVVLVPPKELPYDFFARLLRCRGLMAQGHWPLAVALTAQLDAACEGWVDKSRLAETQWAARMMRIQASQGWARALQESKHVEAARQRREAAGRLRKKLIAQEKAGAYRLVLAAPVLVEPPPKPEPKPVRPRPTTTQARSRPSTTMSGSKPTPSPSKAQSSATTKRSATQPATTGKSAARSTTTPPVQPSDNRPRKGE